MATKRKICFVLTSKIHYSRSKLILQELKKRDDVELQIIVGASAILPRYGDVIEELKSDGFDYNAKITMTLEGGDTVAMAKTTGIGITEFATAFDNLEPDIVVVRADRYEVLSAAIAAAYLNIPVAHLEGGDKSGTIDESVRHAITKLSHIHFPTNEDSRQRIIRMGENPKYVFNVGCPGIELIAKNGYSVSSELINYLGVGDVIDVDNSFLLVMQHPVTTELEKNMMHTRATLEAVAELDIPAIWFWPNVDAGTDAVSKEIRKFRESQNPKHIRFLKYLPTDQFIGLMKRAACMVGNSSAGIKEASFLGVPVVNIGTRQEGRVKGENVHDVPHDAKEIVAAVRAQLTHGPYKPSHAYFKEDTSKEIAKILSGIELYVQKKFIETA